MDIAITEDVDANSALKLVLKKYRCTTAEAGKAFLENPDPESLHDFRVVARRARSLLNQSKGLVREKYRARLCKRLRKIGDLTNAARDLEVFLVDLPTYQNHLPESTHEWLLQLEQNLQQQYQQETDRIRNRLSGKHFKRVLKIWKYYLRGKIFYRRQFTPEAISIGLFARQQATTLLQKMNADTQRLASSSADKDLHAFRIEAKKLRYWVEEFSFLLPEQDGKKFLRKLEKIQTQLGRFQDFTSQIRQLSNGPHTKHQAQLQPLTDLLHQLHSAQGELCKPLIAKFIAMPQTQSLMHDEIHQDY